LPKNYTEALSKKAKGNEQYTPQVPTHTPLSSVIECLIQHKYTIKVNANARIIKTTILTHEYLKKKQHALFFRFQLMNGLVNGPHSGLLVMFYVK
jgi:hypothetical protein